MSDNWYGNGMPDQPDGIDTDTFDMPTVESAAERVRDYIRATGDGLYDVTVGCDGEHPLYARDLEALVRHVLGRG